MVSVSAYGPRAGGGSAALAGGAWLGLFLLVQFFHSFVLLTQLTPRPADAQRRPPDPGEPPPWGRGMICVIVYSAAGPPVVARAFSGAWVLPTGCDGPAKTQLCNWFYIIPVRGLVKSSGARRALASAGETGYNIIIEYGQGETDLMKHVEIYTDGACSGNPRQHAI